MAWFCRTKNFEQTDKEHDPSWGDRNHQPSTSSTEKGHRSSGTVKPGGQVWG